MPAAQSEQDVGPGAGGGGGDPEKRPGEQAIQLSEPLRLRTGRRHMQRMQSSLLTCSLLGKQCNLTARCLLGAVRQGRGCTLSAGCGRHRLCQARTARKWKTGSKCLLWRRWCRSTRPVRSRLSRCLLCFPTFQTRIRNGSAWQQWCRCCLCSCSARSWCRENSRCSETRNPVSLSHQRTGCTCLVPLSGRILRCTCSCGHRDRACARCRCRHCRGWGCTGARRSSLGSRRSLTRILAPPPRPTARGTRRPSARLIATPAAHPRGPSACRPAQSLGLSATLWHRMIV